MDPYETVILLVEDEALIAMVEKEELEAYGYTVITVDSGKRAVDLISGSAGGRIDLILMDINLPDNMDGTEAAENILKERDIPIVFLSSHTDPEVVRKTEKITSYGYVVKKSGITVLDASIKMAFKLFESKRHAETTARRQGEAEERATHLNRMLRSIRGVNRLITHEKNRVRLLDETCRLLTEDHGFSTAWIVLSANGRPVEPFFHAGFGSSFAPMTEYLLSGKIPRCARKVLESGGVSVILDPNTECPECALAGEYGKTACLTARLEHDGRVLGWLSVSMLRRYAENSEERELLAEVAGDIAFALWSMENEDALRKNEALLNRTEHLTGVGGWEYDLVEKRMTWTDEVYRIYGVTPEAYDPNRVDEDISFYAPEDREKLAEAFQNAAVKGVSYDFDLQFVSASGERKWVRTLGCPVTENGRVIKVSGNIMDITARRRVEDELRRERDRAQMYLDVAGIMFVAIDTEGIITLVNRKGCEILGRPACDIIGNSWFDNFLPADNLDEVKNVFHGMMEGRLEPVEFYENPVINAGGEERLIAWHNTQLRDSQGNIIGSLSSGEDITERRRTEDNLQRALTEKQQLLRELQHRIKNSFAMITSLINLMQTDNRSEEVRSVLEELGARTGAVSEMYNLLYQSDSIEEVRLDTYLDRVITSFNLVPDKIKIDSNLESLVITARSAVPVGIIVTELVTNALKYAFPGDRRGTILVSLKKTGNEVRIDVRDDGVGFPPGFNPAEATTMGLSLAHSLADQIEGVLTVRSENGVRCALAFPLVSGTV